MPILALSQINREASKRDDPRPRLEDLKGSGNQEEDADAVILFFRSGYYDKSANQGVTEVSVAKQRGGSVGVVSLRFRPEFVRVEDMEGDYGMFDQDQPNRAVA